MGWYLYDYQISWGLIGILVLLFGIIFIVIKLSGINKDGK